MILNEPEGILSPTAIVIIVTPDKFKIRIQLRLRVASCSLSQKALNLVIAKSASNTSKLTRIFIASKNRTEDGIKL
jgi:hypothetical protein